MNEDKAQENLTLREGFLAMSKFVEDYYRRGSGEMVLLLSDLRLEEDGQPHDPAMWPEWLEAVEHVKSTATGPPGS